MTETTGWTISEWRQYYRQSPNSPTSVLRELLSRLDPQDPAWIHVISEAELQRQITWLEQQPNARDLPLYGVPFAVKDNIDVTQLPTTAACPAFAYTADRDATSVARLRAAGALVLGKTNLDQFATGLVGTRSPYGAVPNSFNPAYVSGGSSSGSASVVARGLVPFSLGTDTAGSGRVPAGFNNIIGLKPTKGRFSTLGVVPACRSLDCVSVFALSLDDAIAVANHLEAFDAEDPYSRVAETGAAWLPAQPRLGIPHAPDWFGDTRAQSGWLRSLALLEALGVELVPLDFAPMFELARLLYGGPWVAERHAAVREFMADHAADMNPVVRGIIEQAPRYSATDAYTAEYQRAALARRIQSAMASVHALVVPTAPRLPTLAEVAQDPVGVNSQLGTYTNFVNLADCSALALPAVMRDDGLPSGITLIGAAWQDAALAEFGRRWLASLDLSMGATGRPMPQPIADNQTPAGYVRLAVVGAHLSGMPLNGQLTERNARFVETTRTSDAYRLFALPNTTPAKPGLIRGDSGSEILVELWDLPLKYFGSFVALIGAPLGIGTLTLCDGRQVKGFICEGWAAEGAADITHFGGWRAYIASLQ